MGSKTATLNACVTGRITNSTMPHQAWGLFFSLITSRVSDPKNRGTDYKWVYSAYPDEEIQDLTTETQIKSEYPLIIVYDPETTSNPVTINQSAREANNEQLIEVYSDRTDTLTTIWQSIRHQILKPSALNTFEECGIFNVTLEDTGYSSMQHAGVKIHVKELRFAYDYEEA